MEMNWPTVAEAAILCGVSKARIYRAITNGSIETRRSTIGKLVDLKALHAYLDEARAADDEEPGPSPELRTHWGGADETGWLARLAMGRPITHSEAAEIAERSLSTIHRWVAKGHVRTDYRWNNELWNYSLYLSENDVLAMKKRLRPGRPRKLRHDQ